MIPHPPPAARAVVLSQKVSYPLQKVKLGFSVSVLHRILDESQGRRRQFVCQGRDCVTTIEGLYTSANKLLVDLGSDFIMVENVSFCLQVIIGKIKQNTAI